MVDSFEFCSIYSSISAVGGNIQYKYRGRSGSSSILTFSSIILVVRRRS